MEMDHARLRSTASLDPDPSFLVPGQPCMLAASRTLFCFRLALDSQPDSKKTHADMYAAEFRGPGTHHRFDDSPDDYDMDMDQRTRFLGGGRGGRIILLGDGTEISVGHIHDDDGDVDMEDRGEAEEAEDNDLEQQVSRDPSAPNGEPAEQDRSKREETPAPDAESSSEVDQPSATKPEDPKTMAATDSVDTKAAAEALDKK